MAKAPAFRPDLVLCDIGLPGIDGFEVARRLRRDAQLCSSCLVAVSGYDNPDDVEKAKAAGFVEHLAKPVDPQALEATLGRVCRRGN